MREINEAHQNMVAKAISITEQERIDEEARIKAQIEAAKKIAAQEERLKAEEEAKLAEEAARQAAIELEAQRIADEARRAEEEAKLAAEEAEQKSSVKDIPDLPPKNE